MSEHIELYSLYLGTPVWDTLHHQYTVPILDKENHGLVEYGPAHKFRFKAIDLAKETAWHIEQDRRCKP